MMTCPFKNGEACSNSCALKTNLGCAITALVKQNAVTNQKLSDIESELYQIKVRVSQMR